MAVLRQEFASLITFQRKFRLSDFGVFIRNCVKKKKEIKPIVSMKVMISTRRKYTKGKGEKINKGQMLLSGKIGRLVDPGKCN